jgi:hypothetical protein
MFTPLWPLFNFVYSPFGAFIAPECEDCGFNDLGTLLFGGIILAVVVAVAYSLIRIKLQNGKEFSSDYVSISPTTIDKTIPRGIDNTDRVS